eukprot:CAMPEP_0118698212 /NCGR_PEP_ID=MMETSP0800-20121206/15054_1 /TAXON_ID=210618 ORGANISM="Striatella unipunctata, Strain CCMP2910" /NCGR_SAMPLE_ID=MMETSP0800 /ASSEMBLY_ACC=CAM_ASM_000638 /LENGTH=293 /DNA_ID=CAMNT_0006597965 /DNA_START=251 /DNA_END=1132 /DNA_ORIENTATION=-
MSELDLCSRREADEYIMEGGRIIVRGKEIESILGQRVASNERDIVLLPPKQLLKFQEIEVEGPWTDRAVVLHKPKGYVSGQPEPGYIPAVRLLTLNRFHNSQNAPLPKHMSDYLERSDATNTLQGYVPAGRLDKESYGLLIFTKCGVLAKKLLTRGRIEKEYHVKVDPAQQLTSLERKKGMTYLPVPTRDLSRLLRGRSRLFGDKTPLLPIKAKWIPSPPIGSKDATSKEEDEILQLMIREGRKHQIRRVCREWLGHHVVDLKRSRIGPVNLDMPEGTWRPLRKDEVEIILKT